MKKCLTFIILTINVHLLISQTSGGKSVSINVNGSTTELYRESYALLIGISHYTYFWPELPGVKKDLQLVKQALEKHGFKVIIVENPTREELDKSMNDFITRYGQKNENRLIIYYAGHGHTVFTNYGEEIGYIIPANTPLPNSDMSGFKETAIPMSQIEIWAKQIDSKHALFLFDACFSGAFFNMTRALPDAISYKTMNPVRQFITSGNENETVSDESMFRREFITAITTDEADANKDGYLTGSELGEFIQTNVTNYSYNRQHPQYGKIRDPHLDKGDFVFDLSNLTNNTLKTASVPKILRTEKLNNYLFYGLYFQLSSAFSVSGNNTKFSLFYSSKLLENRYCFGLEGNYLTVDWVQNSEIFQNLYNDYSDSPYHYISLSLYNRIYLFPQNKSIVNLYAGTSISWNNWQFELGLRPFLTRKIMIELNASYLIHKGNINYYNFSPYGNTEKTSKMNTFRDLYFGFNIIFFKSFV